MRIEIDTVNKTIVVLSHTSMKDLVEKLPEMLKDWESYAITSKVEYQSYPYIYQYPFETRPVSPLSPPFYTTCKEESFGVQKQIPEWMNQPTIISIN